MANRVNVNVNVNDMTRSGLRAVRNNVRNLTRQLPDDHTVTVTLNDNGARIRARALRRALRDLSSDDVNVRVNLTGNAFNRSGRVSRALRNLPDNVRVNINPDPPTPGAARRWGTRARNVLTAPVRQLAAFVGGTMSDGIGQGIIGAFRAAGPVGMAVLAAIIIGSLSMIGAALSGLIVGALGIAFVGVAGVSAAQSEQVKKKWSSVLETLKGEFRSVGEPMIPVLEHSLGLIEKMAKRAGPAFREAMVEAAPATQEFIDKLLEGFERMADQAFEPLMDAWEVFGPILGDTFSDFLDDLGNSFGEMADLVREHSFEIELAIRTVFKIIDFLVDVVTFLGKTWVFMFSNMGNAAGAMIVVMQGLFNVIMTVFDGIISGAAEAFDWIPGIGPKLKEANTAFDNWRNSVNEKLNSAKDTAFGFDEALERMNRTRVLKADINSWNAKLKTARAELKKTTSQKAQAKLKAEISDLVNKVSRARRELNSLNGKTATTYVRTVRYGIGAEAANAARRATGGVIGAAATGGVRSNMTLVGEHGPEIVNLAPGSHVRSNPDSRRFVRSNMGGDGGATLLFKSSGRRVDDLLLEILREAIHQRGGDPVAVLGG